ncbi:MAG TPA: 30S ribosomal protein S1 [Actinomycetota bacterium]|nr:30S ribosomal protein S1 [Actinomycetota bacterium]
MDQEDAARNDSSGQDGQDFDPTPIPPRTQLGEITTREELHAAYDETLKDFNDGDVVRGHVLRIDKDEVLVDIGYKSEGVIPVRELSIRHDVNPNDEVKVGEEIDALVLQKEDKDGRLILSKKRAQYEKAWGVIEERKNAGEVVRGRVIEVVKGGLIVDIGLRGFLPASLVDIRRVGDLNPFVGQELEAKIIELDRNRNNVVLSRRAWLEETQRETRHELLDSLKKGEQRTGKVSSIVKFGAFVDLGGIDGLVHVSELSWKHVEDPAEVVHVGQEVEVEVLDVDYERERISLSLKSTQEDPWQAFGRRHEPGEIIEGRVTKLVSFGAFVQVGDGLEGLVHISELSQKHVQTPAEVVAVGDPVKVKILDVDPKRRRVSLSIKQAEEGYVPGPEGSEQGPLRQDSFLDADSEPEIEPEPEPVEEAPPADETPDDPDDAPASGVPDDTLEAFVRDMNQGS